MVIHLLGDDDHAWLVGLWEARFFVDVNDVDARKLCSFVEDVLAELANRLVWDGRDDEEVALVRGDRREYVEGNDV